MTPDPEYPDTMRPMADSLAKLVAHVARTRALWQAADARQPGRWRPDAEAAVSDAMRRQRRWEDIIGHREGAWRLGNLDPQLAEAVEKAERWLAKGNGPLLIGGNPGRGKTALASAIGYRWAHEGNGLRPVLMARLADVLASFERARQDDPEAVATLRRRLPHVRADWLVILDDLRATAGYPSQVPALTNLVDQLGASRCRLVVTTNLTKPEREQHLEDRLRDRIEGGATTIALTGRNLRDQDPPEAPATEPCPFPGCEEGRVMLGDLPDAHERVMGSLIAYGIREPEGRAYPLGPAGDAMLARDRAWYEGQYDHHATSVMAPCPSCHPSPEGPPVPGPGDF